jgi:hypothetical protein
MIIKNNKIKNSGLLYELLVRQITNDVINSKSSKALDVLKKYYTNILMNILKKPIFHLLGFVV